MWFLHISCLFVLLFFLLIIYIIYTWRVGRGNLSRKYLQESSFHGMISSFHAIIPSFHGMISSFHAVFGLRQWDKSAKVIDYNDQVIRVREYLLFRGIPSPMYFPLSRKRQCTASFPSNVCNLSLKRLQSFPQTFAIFASNVCNLCLKRLRWKVAFCGIPSPQVFLLSTRLGFSPNVGWPYHMVLSLRKGNASPEREELYSRLAKLWGTLPID